MHGSAPCSCLVNADDYFDKHTNKDFPGQCATCGYQFCGPCNSAFARRGGMSRCPMCREPIAMAPEEEFRRLWSLVHDRTPGRHTRVALFNLAGAYAEGRPRAARTPTCSPARARNPSRRAPATPCPAPFVHQRNPPAWWPRAAGAARHCHPCVRGLRVTGASAGEGVAHAMVRSRRATYALDPAGVGVKQDYDEALKWYERAAGTGFARAQCAMGALHYGGLGDRAKDLGKAATWFTLAANQVSAVPWRQSAATPAP